MENSYADFINILKRYKEEGFIKILHRGESKEFSFNCFNLDSKIDSIDSFSDRLYFYGSKSKYFWNKKINPNKDLDFDINDISNDFFVYIFNEFRYLFENSDKIGTIRFFKKNHKTISFFSKSVNSNILINILKDLSPHEKLLTRNHYLRILHQLGESKYKKNSQFLSSSINESIAEKYSTNEIVINFWDLNIDQQKLPNGIHIFTGKPYKNQKEISVFSVILPQFIYSFKYRNKIYPNPAIASANNLESVIFCGLDIDQHGFEKKLKNETNFEKGFATDGNKSWEIK